ncbi:MAG: type II toxin-antitoxin system VapC family toxin [Alphaproteobacteria bacterium]|nr:type II toxin-antitoxin system VapC family toxin [Alphaproteobacteria bacterium]
MLVALFVIDPSNTRAIAFLLAHPAVVVVSDFGAAEFASAVARRVRTRDLTRKDGQIAFLHFDGWIARSARRQEITSADIGMADRLLRRLDVNLRTPDALHIAVAERLGATLVTLDRGMAAASRALGMAVALP